MAPVKMFTHEIPYTQKVHISKILIFFSDFYFCDYKVQVAQISVEEFCVEYRPKTTTIFTRFMHGIMARFGMLEWDYSIFAVIAINFKQDFRQVSILGISGFNTFKC